MARWCGVLMLCVAGMVSTTRGEDPSGLKEQVDRLEREVQGLKEALGKGGDSKVRGDQKDAVVLLMENAALVPMESGDINVARMLILKLSVANLTNDPVLIARKDLELVVNGVAMVLEDVPEQMKNTAFPWGMEFNFLQRVTPFESLRVAAGGTTGGWVFVSKLPSGTQPLKLELVWKSAAGERRVDLMEAARNRMDLSISRIGPKGCLGLFEIRGEFNSLSSGVLVQELEKLANERVSRVVMVWEKGAGQVEPQLANWLRMSAEARNGDRSQTSGLPFPMIPAGIQVLHLAGMPSPDFQPTFQNLSMSGQMGQKRVFENADEAVEEGLRDVLEAAPREELLLAIQKDHPLGKGAALAIGSGRLLSEDLPLVLKEADAGEVVVQEGALKGLGHFGEQEAIEKLLFWVQKGVEPLSSVAAMSLATSRFPPAQEKLLNFLKNESASVQEKLLDVLIKNPRPMIAEPLHQFVIQHPSRLKPEYLRALEELGFPELTKLAARGLLSDQEPIQSESLRILIVRNSAEGDEIATNWSLEYLKSHPPTDAILKLLKRVKEQRAVPSLLKALRNNPESMDVLETIGLIADPAIAGELLEMYPKVPTGTQAELLTILKNWEIPEFRELAHAALSASDNMLVMNAAKGLIDGKGDRGLPWIEEVLVSTRKPEIITTLVDTLASLGDSDAQGVLRRVRQIDSEVHRQAAMNGLSMIRSRSPGYQMLSQGLTLASGEPKQYREAIGFYDQAIKLDDQLMEAYSGRANCHLRLNNFKGAGIDFQKALEIEPFNSDALTGLCVVMATDGRWEEAIRKLEEKTSLFEKDMNFQYNSACIMGRVVEYLEQKQDVPNREALIETYKKRAIDHLRKGMQGGFEDLKWMQEDPDLKSLRGLPEFQRLIQDKKDEQKQATEPIPPGEADVQQRPAA